MNHFVFYTGPSFDLRNEHWCVIDALTIGTHLLWNRNGVTRVVPRAILRETLHHIADTEEMVRRGILPEFPEKHALVYWEQAVPMETPEAEFSPNRSPSTVPSL